VHDAPVHAATLSGSLGFGITVPGGVAPGYYLVPFQGTALETYCHMKKAGTRRVPAGVMYWNSKRRGEKLSSPGARVTPSEFKPEADLHKSLAERPVKLAEASPTYAVDILAVHVGIIEVGIVANVHRLET